MMPTRPGVVRAAPTVTRVPAFRLPSASLDRLRPASRGVLSPPLDRAAPRGARREVAGHGSGRGFRHPQPQNLHLPCSYTPCESTPPTGTTHSTYVSHRALPF